MGIIVIIYILYLLALSVKKGIILIAILLQQLSYLGSGIAGVKLYTLASMVCIPYFYFGNHPYSKGKYPKLLLIPSLLFSISYSLTTLFTSQTHHEMTVLINIYTFFVFPFMFWHCLSDKKYLLYAIKVFYYLLIISSLFALAEVVTRKNIGHELLGLLFSFEDYVDDFINIRYGVKRISSLFAYGGPCGMFFIWGWILLYSLLIIYKIKLGKLHGVLIFTIPFFIFATGSRAVYIGFVISLLFCMINKHILHNRTFKKIFVIIVLSLPIWYPVISSVADSIFNSSSPGQVEGSSSDMRINQLAICLDYFENSPWLGNGKSFIWDVVRPDNPELLGAESAWFPLLVDWGLLGSISHIILIVCCTIFLCKKNLRYASIPLAYLATTTLGPDVGMQYNCLLVFVVIFAKMSYFFSDEEKLQTERVCSKIVKL